MSQTETATREREPVHVPDLVDPAEHGEGLTTRSNDAQQQPPPSAAPRPSASAAEAKREVAFPLKSQEIGALASALAAAQVQFDSIVKNQEAEIESQRTNKKFSYEYADLATILAVVRPILGHHGIALVQLPNNNGAQVSVSTLLIHGESGQFLRNTLAIETGNIADPKALGSAITYLRKYAVLSIVGVAPEDDDGAAAAGTSAPPPPRPGAPPPPPRAPPPPPRPPPAQRSAGTDTPPQAAASTPAPKPQPKAPPPAAAAPKAAPAKPEQAAGKHVGLIEGIEPRGDTAVMITFTGGFKASCSRTLRKAVVEALERHYKNGDQVEVQLEPSSDPAQYPPRVTGVAQQLQSTREPGEEG